MENKDLIQFLESAGKDPSRLIFEDELTGIFNRRFLLRYLDTKIPWGRFEDRSVSLIMLDLDHFKSINDTYGHQVGDQALLWLATHLKASVGEDGLPIRYAGDEFMLLLEKSGKSAALAIGQQLVEQVRAMPFPIPDTDAAVNITISLGVATAPADASEWKGFVRQADMALYLAKKRGRNQLADAAEVIQEEVSEKAAIHQLDTINIVGRKAQLAKSKSALQEFRQKKSQVLLVEGSAGMGKTEFLSAVAKSMARGKAAQVRAHGNPQEMFRPYYFMETLAIGIMNQRKDKGLSILKDLGVEEQGFLSLIMPGLGLDAAPPEGMDESALRKGIFGALLAFITRAVGDVPLFLFIDDMHYVDEGTLQLLRRLILRDELRLFVLGTASEASEVAADEPPGPLDRFVASYEQELGLTRFPLTPLTTEDTLQHIQRLFPNIQLPLEFTENIVNISQGNPLFLAEILRKLVLDHQITLVGQQWTLHPIEEGYLPNSMEDIVTEKIAALDEESRQLLDQVSALGENVSLSMLIGSSDQMEAKVLDFIDQAAAQGLLASDFALNDENIRFLGKRILEITYNAIEPERKEQLHEQIGVYQEGLYEKLQASAASLAYHFKRSNDTKKAENYERIQTETNIRHFNAEEAAEYSGDMPSEEPLDETPLSKEGITHVPGMIRTFTVALRNIKFYPPGSKSVSKVNEDLKKALDQVLEDNECLSLSQSKNALVINGQRMDITDFKLVADSFIEILERFDLKGIAFHKGVLEEELTALTDEMGRSEKKVFEEDHWETFAREHKLQHIALKQMRYKMQKTTPQAGKAGATAGPGLRMDADALALVPEIVRALLSAARTIKLYPISSKASENAVDLLASALQQFLNRYSLLTLSHVGGSLLINGEKIDTSDYKALGEGLLKYFDVIGLSSLTFLDSHTRDELKTLISTLGDLPPSGTDPKFWKGITTEKKLSGILFDQHMFEVKVKHTAGGAGAGGQATVAQQQVPVAEPASLDVEPESSGASIDALVENMPEVVSELFLKDNIASISKLMKTVFHAYPDSEVPIREKTLDACRQTLDPLTPAYQHDFARIISDHLLRVFLEEKDANMMVQTVAFMHRLAAALIQFTDYPHAARLLMALNKRGKDLRQANSAMSQALAKNIGELANPTIQKLLVEDFLSGETKRQRNAAQLIAGFGPAAIPMLIEAIKTVDDYRTRHVSVMLLEKSAPQAGDHLKRVLMQESAAEEKIRILEVIEFLTRDVEAEIGQLIGDENPQVRHAALSLLERINDPKMAEVLLHAAKEPKTELAIEAITCLGKIKPPGVVDDLVAILNAGKEESRIKACCLALGDIGSKEGIAPLAKVLNHKGFIFSRKKYSDDVRAAAAFALGRINHPEAREALKPHLDHADPRIRQIAAEKTGATPPPPPPKESQPESPAPPESSSSQEKPKAAKKMKQPKAAKKMKQPKAAKKMKEPEASKKNKRKSAS